MHFLKILCLFCFLLLAGCGGTEIVLSNISEDDANQAVSALLTAGISAQKIASGDKSNVTVPKDDMARALVVLRINGIPRAHYAQFKDLFPGDSFTSSPTEERARYVELLKQSIEQTLSLIEGVVSARVHVVLPQKATFLDPSIPASAGVFLQHLPSVDLSGIVLDIRRLVANGVPGLVPDRVVVMLAEANNMTTNMNLRTGAGATTGKENIPSSPFKNTMEGGDDGQITFNQHARAPKIINQESKNLDTTKKASHSFLFIFGIGLIVIISIAGVLSGGYVYFIKKRGHIFPFRKKG